MEQNQQHHDRSELAGKTRGPRLDRKLVPKACGALQSCICSAIFSQAAPPLCRNLAAVSSIHGLYYGGDAIPLLQVKSLNATRALVSANTYRHRRQRSRNSGRSRQQLQGMICEWPYYNLECV